MDLKITSCLGLLIAMTAWPGCQPVQKNGPSASDQTEQLTEQPVTYADIPTPPGLSPDMVQPWRDDTMTRAQMPLDQVIAQLARPDFLPAPDTREANPPPAAAEPRPSSDRPIIRNEPPLTAQRAYWAGRTAWRNRKLFEAIRHLETALRLAPNNADILQLLGVIYIQSGNHIRGGIFLEKSVAQNSQDIDSIFRLGRIFVQQGRWADAIATYTYAIKLDSPAADPAMKPLLQYFLGHALAHEGYDSAAIELLSAHLALPDRIDRTTRMARQLMVLGRQRYSTWETVGDAYSRLDRPQDALLAYEEAIRAQPNPSNGLIRRYVYICLRLKKPEPAVKSLVQYIQRHSADATSLKLVGYLSDHGTGKDELAEILRKVYDSDNRQASLAITIADLLDPAAAHHFLTDHLRQKPADRSVFDHFIKLPPSVDGHSHAHEALEDTLDIIERLPTAAQEYSSILIDAAADPAKLLESIAALPADRRQRPVTHFLKGRIHSRLDQLDLAIAALEQAITGDPTLIAAQTELAAMLIQRGDYPRAHELLQGLSHWNDMRVVKLKLKVLRHQGQIAAAIRFLDERLKQDLTHTVELVIEKAHLYLAIGDAIQAQQILSDTLENHPRAEPLYDLLIRLYRTNKIPNASRQYQQLIPKMLKTIPRSRVARTERARLLVVSGKFDQAEPILRALLAEDPDNLSPIDPLLILLVKTDRRAQADQLIGERLRVAPDDRSLLILTVHHYRRVKDQPKVIQTTNHLLALLMTRRPRDLPLLNLLLGYLVEAGDDARGRELLEQALTDEPNDEGLLTLARQHYGRIDDPQRFMEMTEKLLLLKGPSPARAQALAMLYLQHDQHPKAIDVLTEALADPSGDEYARVLINLLARAWSASGQPQKAYARYESAIKRLPEQALDLTFDWAMLCERNGDKQDAQKILAGLLKVQPDHAMANNALGYAWANRGENLPRAKEMITHAVEAEPNNAAYLDSMGWVFYKLGEFQKAIVWLKRAQAAPGGEYPVIVDHLGDALYRAGNMKRALSAWQTAITQLLQIEDLDDPELAGLVESLRAKITAVKAKQDAPVADAPGWHEKTSQPDDAQQHDPPPDEPAKQAPPPDAATEPEAAQPVDKPAPNQPPNQP